MRALKNTLKKNPNIEAISADLGHWFQITFDTGLDMKFQSSICRLFLSSVSLYTKNRFQSGFYSVATGRTKNDNKSRVMEVQRGINTPISRAP